MITYLSTHKLAFSETRFPVSLVLTFVLIFVSSLTVSCLQVSQITLPEFGLILACIMASLTLRLLAAFLVALANDLSIKESLFIAITWIPKAIVEVKLTYTFKKTYLHTIHYIPNYLHAALFIFIYLNLPPTSIMLIQSLMLQYLFRFSYFILSGPDTNHAFKIKKNFLPQKN